MDVLSKAGNLVSEDIVYKDENMAWVLDASTGLTKKKLTCLESDGLWFVKEWDKYLKKHLLNEAKSIDELVKEGINEIREGFYKECNLEFAESIQRPSASAVIIRRVNDCIEYFLLGDCTLLIEEKSGEIVKLKDDTIEKLDKKAADKMQSEREEKNLTFKEAREFINKTLIEHRLLKNKEGGYWVLEFEGEAVNHSIAGSLDIKNIKSLTLMSDGYSAIFDSYNYLSEDELMKELWDGKMEEVYTKIREIEDEDSDMLKYPRFKKGDDSSVVFYKVNN